MNNPINTPADFIAGLLDIQLNPARKVIINRELVLRGERTVEAAPPAPAPAAPSHIASDGTVLGWKIPNGRKRSDYTEQRVAIVQRCTKNGVATMSADAIGRAASLSASMVARLLDLNGIERRRRNGFAVTAEDIETMRRMVAEDRSLEQIAAATGYSITTVKRHVGAN